MTASERRAPVPAALLRWPEGGPRVLCTDAWLANAGDALIALALERMLRSIAPGAAVLHAAYQWDSVGSRLPGTFVPPLEDLLGTPWADPAPGCAGRGAAVVDGADLVVGQGGGYLDEAYDPRARIAALADVVRRGRPLALVGISLGCFSDPWMRSDLQTVLRGAVLVVARDERSLEHAADAGAVAPVLGTDLALECFLEPPARVRAPRGIGVVLTDHHADAGRRPQRAASAARLLDAVLDASGDEPVHVWSTVQGAAHLARDDDAVLAARLVAALPPAAAARVTVEPGLVTPDRALALVGEARALVTMRMHPALIAAGSGVPFALVLDDDRRAVFSGTPLADTVVDSGDPDRVAAVVARVLSADGEARGLRWRATAPLRARLGRTRHEVERVLGAHASRGERLDRVRHVARRAIAGLSLAAETARGALPHRAVGAVQGPRQTGVGPATVWGWARAPVAGDEVVAVLVSCEGRTVLAGLGPAPADVDGSFPPDHPQRPVGWATSMTFDGTRVERPVDAVAITAAGRRYPLTPMVVGVDPARIGRILEPQSRVERDAGPLRIAGVLTPDAPPARIEVRVDGRPAGRARQFSHDDPGTAGFRPLTGFEHVVTLAPAERARVVRVEVVATALDGTPLRVGDVEVRVRPTAAAAPTATVRPRPSPGRSGSEHRTAVLTHGLQLGGAQLWLQEVLRHRAVCEPVLVVAGADGPLRRELESFGATVVVRESMIRAPGDDDDGALRGLVRDFRPDVVLANTVLATRGVAAVAALDLPLVWAVHEHLEPAQVWDAGAGGGAPATARLVRLLDAADRLVFVCDATRDLYAREIGPSPRQVVEPYGIDVDALDRYAAAHTETRFTLRRTAGIPDGAFLVTSLGTIEPRKGPAVLIAALATLAERWPTLHVALVGDTGGDYARAVVRLAAALGVAERLHVIPATREPAGWLLAGDAFVMASDLESMPRAAMEAMATRLPVVLGDVAGCRELLDDGRAGLLVPARDLGALVDALDRLMAMTWAERNAMGAAARERVTAHHGDYSYAARVSDLLDDVRSESGQTRWASSSPRAVKISRRSAS